MLLNKVWRTLTNDVFPIESTERLFNQYRDHHPTFDRPNAPEIRRDNLHAYLSAYTELPRVFLVAEAPGPWGCRFSGVPITSEAQLLDAEFPVHGRQSSTSDVPYSEYSANIHWGLLAPFFPHFLTWNTVPFHPYKDDPLSIRTPTNREIDRFGHVIGDFLEEIKPDFVVAVGRKAERALNHLDCDNIYVRHPSQGGAGLFRAGVTEVLRAAEILGEGEEEEEEEEEE